MTKPKVDLFLDSGAFSAFTQGVAIDIYEYIDFIKKYQDVIEIYANLDVIGTGKDSAKETYKNQKIMEEAGLNPIPVFHLHEPFKYLKRYCENYDYIALGIAGVTQHQTLVPWMNKCFTDYICDGKGWPKLKVHGFAVTSLKLMLRYPWYSVDSTSWVITGRMGGIYVPRIENGKWIYDQNSWKVAISSRSPKRSNAGQHISTFSPRIQEGIIDYITHKGYNLGKSEFRKESESYKLKDDERWAGKPENGKREVELLVEKGISNIYQWRDEMNVIYFKDLEASMPEWPWPFVMDGPGLLF